MFKLSKKRFSVLAVVIALATFTLCDAQQNFLTLATIFNAAGQMITSNSNGTPVQVAAGTSGQVLGVNSSGLPAFTSGPVAAGYNFPPYVPTMAATPVAGTNNIIPGFSVIPTAAANAAGILAPLTGTINPGDSWHVWNSDVSTHRLKAGGGATLNGATAGGYLIVATLLSADCFATSATNIACTLGVNPTPAGP